MNRADSRPEPRPVPPVSAVVVVVPAHNERAHLPACLAALSRAAGGTELPVHVVVVLDRCTDGSESVLAAYPQVRAVTVAQPVADQAPPGLVGVGWARHLGVLAALEQVRDVPADRLWLASTDADSQVPAHWVAHQVALADAGADLVLGTVELDVEHTGWRDSYARKIRADGSHSHVHGANLGLRASTYQAAGGWPALAAHEDVQLTLAVTGRVGARVRTTSGHAVLTSARLAGRAPQGLARDLRELNHQICTAPCPATLCPATYSELWSECVN